MSQKTKLLLTIYGVGAIALGLAGFILLASGQESVSPNTTGTTVASPIPAPDFELNLLSGKKLRLSDFKGKKPVVINFWASWCPPCRQEAPGLARVAKTYEKDVEFIGVAINDTKDDAQAYIKEFGITYKNGLDTTNIGGAYKITGIPGTFWIDKDGRIIDRWIGAIDEQSMIARTERLIGGS